MLTWYCETALLEDAVISAYTLPSQTPGDEPARNTMNSAIDTTDIVATALNALQLVYGVWTLTESRAPDVISHA